MRPIYIALEGIEGCGKSTQATLLVAHLLAKGRKTILTRESGGTDVGGMIRQIVVHHPGGVDPMCEALLFAADRAQHITEVVEPAIGVGLSVVSDRSLWSSIAYQGYGRGLGEDALYRINQLAVHDTFPDLVIFLSIDQETMNLRLAGRPRDRIERAGSEFFERVIYGYDKMRVQSVDEWIVIDGIGTTAEVAERIAKAVDVFIEEWWQGE